MLILFQQQQKDLEVDEVQDDSVALVKITAFDWKEQELKQEQLRAPKESLQQQQVDLEVAEVQDDSVALVKITAFDSKEQELKKEELSAPREALQ